MPNPAEDGGTTVTPAEGGAAESTTTATFEIPEKFRNEDGSLNQEGILKSYAELEAQFSGGKKPEVKEGGAAQEASTETPETEEGGGAASEEGKQDEAKTFELLDVKALEQELFSTGQVSDETLADFLARGIPEDTIASFLEGQAAKAELLIMKLGDYVGGRSKFEQMAEWAGEQYTEDELAVFNADINSKDEVRIRQALDGLSKRYSREYGREAAMFDGGSAADGDIFQSKAEWQSALNDSRYDKDPAFRQKVEQKFARSKAAGKF